MLRQIRHRLPTLRIPFCTSTEAAKQTATESRWRRLERERRQAPIPANRTAYEFDDSLSYPLQTALFHVRSASWAKFDESLELIFRLYIDPRQADQNIRSFCLLPHPHGRKTRLGVFADGQDASAALEAGADAAGAEELVDEMRNAKEAKKFDMFLAQPHLMGMVAGKIGRVLGPRGLMPAERDGTVWNDVVQGVESVGRLVRFRTDKDGNVQMGVGKLSMKDEHLMENVKEAFRRIVELKPQSVKKKYMRKVVICSSMGRGVNVDGEQLFRETIK